MWALQAAKWTLNKSVCKTQIFLQWQMQARFCALERQTWNFTLLRFRLMGMQVWPCTTCTTLRAMTMRSSGFLIFQAGESTVPFLSHVSHFRFVCSLVSIVVHHLELQKPFAGTTVQNESPALKVPRAKWLSVISKLEALVAFWRFSSALWGTYYAAWKFWLHPEVLERFVTSCVVRPTFMLFAVPTFMFFFPGGRFLPGLFGKYNAPTCISWYAIEMPIQFNTCRSGNTNAIHVFACFCVCVCIFLCLCFVFFVVKIVWCKRWLV